MLRPAINTIRIVAMVVVSALYSSDFVAATIVSERCAENEPGQILNPARRHDDADSELPDLYRISTLGEIVESIFFHEHTMFKNFEKN